MPDNSTLTSGHNDSPLVEWLDRMGSQDYAALKMLYDACSPRLYGLAMRIVNNRDWAEDVLQEAFLTIWRTAGSYRESLSPPMAWMGMVVRSRALDFLRRRSAERSHLTQTLDDEVADHHADDRAGPMEMALASEQAWALHQCLGKLEHRQREVVSLAYLRDLSHGELASQLQLPLGTVKTWIRRGLDQLRVCMARFA